MSKTVIVPSNAHMSYIVSKEGYSTIKGNVVVDSDKVIDVVLEEKPTTAMFTINPTPSDAVVTLTADGYTQEGNSIEVDVGTNVEYSVEGKPEVLYAWDYEDPYDNADTLTIYTTSPTPIVGSMPCDENGNEYGYSTIVAQHAYILDPTIDEVSDTMISITSSVEK